MLIEIWILFFPKEDCYVDVACITRPIVIAEIAPNHLDFISDISDHHWSSRAYACIDQHRIEKAGHTASCGDSDGAAYSIPLQRI